MTPARRRWWITNPDDGYNGIYNNNPDECLKAISVIEFDPDKDVVISRELADKILKINIIEYSYVDNPNILCSYQAFEYLNQLKAAMADKMTTI